MPSPGEFQQSARHWRPCHVSLQARRCVRFSRSLGRVRGTLPEAKRNRRVALTPSVISGGKTSLSKSGFRCRLFDREEKNTDLLRTLQRDVCRGSCGPAAARTHRLSRDARDRAGLGPGAAGQWERDADRKSTFCRGPACATRTSDRAPAAGRREGAGAQAPGQGLSRRSQSPRLRGHRELPERSSSQPAAGSTHTATQAGTARARLGAR